jgi:hypothetical protein
MGGEEEEKGGERGRRRLKKKGREQIPGQPPGNARCLVKKEEPTYGSVEISLGTDGVDEEVEALGLTARGRVLRIVSDKVLRERVFVVRHDLKEPQTNPNQTKTLQSQLSSSKKRKGEDKGKGGERANLIRTQPRNGVL